MGVSNGALLSSSFRHPLTLTVEAIEHDRLKLAYFSGVLDAQVMSEAEHGSAGS